MAVDSLLQWSRDSEWIAITFIGGEPLLEYGLLRDLVVHAKTQTEKAGKRVSFDMTTNGTLLEEEHCRFFSDQGVRYILSLDGGPEDNGRNRTMPNGQSQYAILADKMRMLKQYQYWQGSRVTVMPETAARLCQNVRHLHEELAINQFVIGFATGVKWPDRAIADFAKGLMETFEYYLEERTTNPRRRLRIGLLEVGQIEEAYNAGVSARWGCGAGSGRIAVAPDGTLHGCAKMAFAHRDAGRLLPLGTVESGLDQIANRMRLLNRTSDCRPKCRGCPIARRCNGGCYAANITDTNNMYTPSDSYCKLVYAQIQAVDYARRRLRELGFEDLCWAHDVRTAATRESHA